MTSRDTPARLALLKDVARAFRFKLPDDAARFLVANGPANRVGLLRALVRAGAWASLTEQPLTAKLVRHVLRSPTLRKT